MVCISCVETKNEVLSAHSLISRLLHLLEMPDETLALAYTCMARFQEAAAKLSSKNPLPHLDDHTIALACLHLSDKMTYSLSQPAHLLVAAWHLLHPDDPFLCPPWLAADSSSPFTNGEIFTSLRNALDAAETVVLRVLAFEISLPTPVLYDEECLERGLAIAHRGVMLAHYQQHHPEQFKSSNKRKLSSGAADEDLCRKKRKQEIFLMPDSTELATLPPEPMIGTATMAIAGHVRQLSLEACKQEIMTSISASIVAAAAVYVVLSDDDLAPPFAWSDESQYEHLLSWANTVAALQLDHCTFYQFVGAVYHLRELDAAAVTLAQR